MIRSWSLVLCLLAGSATLFAESKNPADYPLRIHIFGRSQTTFYTHRELEESKGDGRANVFQNSQPHGADFNYECSQKLRSSIAYETYPAKWKKPNQELVVLMPVFGKANSYWTCNLKTDVKDIAYVSHNGNISPEPAADFKNWMTRHDYDPEHGKDIPARLDPPPATAAPATAPQ
jgi:hypothetical protein